MNRYIRAVCTLHSHLVMHIFFFQFVAHFLLIPFLSLINSTFVIHDPLIQLISYSIEIATRDQLHYKGKKLYCMHEINGQEMLWRIQFFIRLFFVVAVNVHIVSYFLRSFFFKLFFLHTLNLFTAINVCINC